jgi:predicted acylesterase/phospholipase RssA
MMRVGVAISGGGHRATAWGTGAVLALFDAGLGPEITSIASVSGGSITNGVLAHDLDLNAATPTDVETSLRRLLRHITGEGLFWFGPPTDRWLRTFLAAAVLAATSFVGLIAAFLLAGREVAPWWLLLLGVVGVGVGLLLQPKLRAMGMPTALRHWLLGLLVFAGVPAAILTAITTWAHEWWLAGACVLATVLAGITKWWFLHVFAGRGSVVDKGLQQAHFGAMTLAAADRPVHHVFCATDLQSGDPVFFTPRVVSGYRLGFGTPGDLPLSTAVQCSANLPGAFPPRVLDNRDNRQFHFERKYDTTRPGFPAAVDHVVVNDGGVYDNMADQWEQGFVGRASRTGSPLDGADAADFLVVVNAGKALGWNPWRTGRLLADVPGLSRTINVLYDVSTSYRRMRLVSTWETRGSGSGPPGVLSHIATSPLAVIWRFAKQGDADQRSRAEAALPVVQGLADFDDWRRIADESASAKTTLGRLPMDVVAGLVWHAYVLTVVSLRVIHGLGPALTAERLSKDRFVELCRPAAASPS